MTTQDGSTTIPSAPYASIGDETGAGLVRWRVWLVPAVLLLVLLAPLLRDGLPATEAGALPLAPQASAQHHGAGWWNLWSLPLGFKGGLALTVVVMSGLAGSAATSLWGRGAAWWSAGLWLTLPLAVSLVYQVGWIDTLGGAGCLLLAAACAGRVSRRTWWPAVGALLFGGAGAWLLWHPQPSLAPYQLFDATWPDPVALRAWLSAPSYQLGLVPTVLAGLAAWMAWPRRAEPVAKRVLALVAVAAVGVSLTLVGGPVRLWHTLAVLALLLAAGGLPALDARYRTLPVRLGALAIAALTVYPALDVAWHDTLPTAPMAVTFEAGTGGGALWLLEADVRREGDEVTVEALWQALAPLSADYSAFVHLLDEGGEIVAQGDALLVDNDAVPTTGWPRGYLARQTYTATSDRAVQVRFGLYDLATSRRLPLDDGQDSLLLDIPTSEGP